MSYVYGKQRAHRAYAVLNHTHKFTLMNQNGKILSRRTRETNIKLVAMALLLAHSITCNIPGKVLREVKVHM